MGTIAPVIYISSKEENKKTSSKSETVGSTSFHRVRPSDVGVKGPNLPSGVESEGTSILVSARYGVDRLRN